MVKKKRLTKRKTLLTKYKIFRKAKDKDRKLNKAAKKNPLFKSKLRKDPGVPNLWPFKQEILEKIQQHKEQEKAEKEQRKVEKKARREAQNDDEEMDDDEQAATTKAAPSSVSQMAKLRFEAAQKEAEFETKKSLMGTENEDGVKDIRQNAVSQASKRAYYREFKKVVEASDVILEILDARDPLGCRCPDIEKTILSTNPNKKIVLVLNKIDLVPREVVQKWMDYFRTEFPTIAFKASTQKQRENISQRGDNPLTADNHSRKSSACLGANALIQLLKNYSRSADIKKNITVGIIGYPNVGKSSVINSLKRTKVVNVGAMPGLTKSLQEIHLDQNIKLLDCPGIIFSSNPQLDAEIILRNAVRIEQLDDVVSPVEQLLKRCKKERLMSHYGIPEFNGAEEFLAHVAKARGRLKAGGKPKITQAGKIVLKDWTSGKIPFFTLPPAAPQTAAEQFNAMEHDKWAHVNQTDDLMMVPSLKERMGNKEDFIPLVSSSAPNNVTVEEDLDKADYAQDLEDSDSEVEMDDEDEDDDE